MPDEIDDDVTEQLDVLDTVDDTRFVDWLDEGWSPADRPWAVEDWGTTAREMADGEGLGARLARELPDVMDLDEDGDDGIGDVVGSDGEERDGEVGGVRSGRLVAAEGEGEGTRNGSDLVATDVGIDGAGASAEEAAVHVVDDR